MENKKQVRYNMERVRDDISVQHDMKVYGHCERMRSNPANYFARSADKNLSPFTFHFSPTHFSQRCAFTLAEILITLGIIGVVAAMTMPSLIQKYQEKVTVTHLKKVNSILNQAYQRAIAEYGPISGWFPANSSGSMDENGEWPSNMKDNSKFLWEKLSKYMKTVSVCYGSDKSCKRPHIVPLGNESNDTGTYSSLALIKLEDGTNLFDGWIGNANCSTPYTHCGDFQVDLNGDKKPNVYGKDVFNFLITPNGIFPNGTPALTGKKFPQYCDRKLTFDSNGYACTAWIIYNENMDYLHCDDLSWDGKHKCSDK